MRPRLRIVVVVLALVCAGCAGGGDAPRPAGTGSTGSTGSTTQGPATVTAPDLLPCPAAPDARAAVTGTVGGTDGTSWATPTDLAWAGTPRLDDLYNECTGVRAASMSEIDLERVPIREIDPGGEVVTGYLFADNYVELFVNGVLVGVDPVPYTPFNAAVVRFRVQRPVTYAVRLVDWEENAGLGTERLGADPFHPGDGGFIASFSDGTVTDASWRAQAFVVAPLDRPGDVVERGTVRDTSGLGDPARAGACAERCVARRYPVPPDWAAPGPGPDWPEATTYTEDRVGASLPAFVNFRPQLTAGGARFIWTSDLVRNDVVLARTTRD